MAKLSIRQKKLISKFYAFTRAENQLIRLYKNDWENNNLKTIIKEIRKHYLSEQNELCAFCKLPFRDDIQVEHFVPKAGKYGRTEYTFYSLNLIVACKHCNSKKSTNNDMIPWTRKPYPKTGIYFKIVHPHFDDYFKNIEIVDKSRYVSKSIKGYNTIQRCQLYHPTILSVLAKSMRYEDDPLIQGVLRIRDMQGSFKKTIDRFIRSKFK